MATDLKKEELFLKATLLASSISGFLGKLISHPLDTVKAKAQVDSTKLSLQKIVSGKKILNTIVSTYKNEGIKGFFSGVWVASIGGIPANILYFATYETSINYYRRFEFFKERDSLRYFTAGMTAETVSCMIWLPIDITKERLQVQFNLKTYVYKNSIDAARQIIKADGFIGLYKAYGATLASFGPFSALNFMFYENFKSLICKDPKLPGLFESMALSTISSTLSTFITSPLDMAKLRMQIQRGERSISGNKSRVLSEGRFGYKNMFHGIYLIVKNEGFLALYKGVSPKIMQAAFNVMLSFTLLEWLRKYILLNYYNYDKE